MNERNRIDGIEGMGVLCLGIESVLGIDDYCQPAARMYAYRVG